MLGQRGRVSWLTARPRGLQVPSARCLRTRCQPRRGGREQLCRVPAPYQQQQPLGARPSACALPHSRTGKPWRSPLCRPAPPCQHSTLLSSPEPRSSSSDLFPAPSCGEATGFSFARSSRSLCPCEQRDVTTLSTPGRRWLSHQLWLKPSSSREGNTPEGQQGGSSGQTLPGGLRHGQPETTAAGSPRVGRLQKKPRGWRSPTLLMWEGCGGSAACQNSV